jgi:hypothetical protein
MVFRDDVKNASVAQACDECAEENMLLQLTCRPRSIVGTALVVWASCIQYALYDSATFEARPGLGTHEDLPERWAAAVAAVAAVASVVCAAVFRIAGKNKKYARGPVLHVIDY